MTDQNKPAKPAQALNGDSAQKPAKKSNACLIIAIIVLALLILAGAGGYFVYKYVKGKVKTAIDDSSNSSPDYQSSNSSATSSANTDQEVKNNYNNTDPVTPTSTFGKTAADQIATIVEPIFGGAKLVEWMDFNESNSMKFLFPRKVAAADLASIETAFINNGYSKDAIYNTSEEMSAYFNNSDMEIMLTCTVGDATLTATTSKITP